MITIRHPRYRDRKVLLARFRIPCGKGVQIKILEGSYKGIYNVSSKVICSSPVETMTTKTGRPISMRAVDLDNLERVDDDE